MRALAAVAVPMGLVASGCEIVAGFEDFEGAGGGAAAQSTSTTTTGGSCDASSPPSTNGGPVLVAADLQGGGCFFIDETEVTVAEYQAFLEEMPSPTAQSSPCANNLAFEPDATCLSAITAPVGAQPVVCVDWCDALAFCTWAGKRLCKGGFGAGAEENAAVSEWYAACSSVDEATYPYGDAYQPDLCAGSGDPTYGCTEGACTTAEVKTHTSCASTPYDPIYDLSGNVAEWVDECSTTAESANCNLRGGSVASNSSSLECRTASATPRLDVGPYVGFRCCADAP